MFTALPAHSLRTHYLTHTFCFQICAQTSRVSRRLGALCQVTHCTRIHGTAIHASMYTYPFGIVRLDAIPVVAREPGSAWA